jgi:hypothetical protein
VQADVQQEQLQQHETQPQVQPHLPMISQQAPGSPAAAPAGAAGPAVPSPLHQRDAASKLRTQPAEGCCTTLEAAAAALTILECQPGLFDQVVAPLRLLTQQQAGFNPAVAARVAPGGTGVVQSKRRMGMGNRLDSS